MIDSSAKAWQPLTFGGIARYAHDWLGRLLFACLIVSILTASVVVWTTSRAWFPVIEQSIARLPTGAEIRGGRLTAPQPVNLAENLFLALGLDPIGQTTPPSLADVQIFLKPDHIRFRSLFGVALLPYQPQWTVPLTRADWEAKWPAWKPAVIAYLFFGTIAELFASWIALGAVYAIPMRVLAYILRRRITLWGSWKLSVAALLPAAILLTVALAIYGLGQIRLAELALAWGLHFIIGWVFIVGATLRLSYREKTPPNPFSEDAEEIDGSDETPPPEKNPFKRSGSKKRS
jgi:hypothetical protein